MFLINYRSYGQFADQGVLAAVADRLAASDVISEEDFADAALQAFRFDGEELTCLPQNVSSLAVYYNVDLFDAAGVPPPQAGWPGRTSSPQRRRSPVTGSTGSAPRPA